GVLGQKTLAELERVRRRANEDELVSVVHEQLVHTSVSALAGARVAVGEEGGFSAAIAAVARALSAAAALPVPLHHPDGSSLAAAANGIDADVYVGLQLDPDSKGCRTLYYHGFTYESPVSRRLAEMLQATLPKAVGVEDLGVVGMALPVLRETRMAAVVIELGPPAQIVERERELADAIVSALGEWAATSCV
ncbi:MAG TPA: N-acetylmuramoyl-L-alanine amidase, partial [Acidimicrobiales bacterium]|nr:N-acetylmuramoyl-L-alanine amidase [Acidimicrobiales bacterium]